MICDKLNRRIIIIKAKLVKPILPNFLTLCDQYATILPVSRENGDNVNAFRPSFSTGDACSSRRAGGHPKMPRGGGGKGPRAAGRLVAVLVLVALLASPGCGGGGAPRSLSFGLRTEPNSLDPLMAPDIYSQWATGLVYDGLVEINDRLEVIPALAASWDVSDDGLVWRFALRRDVRWHDGTVLTAADVRRTYEAILDPAGAVTLPRSDFQSIARVETPDDWSVNLVLRQPDASLLSKLTVGIAKRPSPKTETSVPGRTAGDWIGTGPFKLSEWVSGERLVFQANGDYYAGAPGLNRLIWQVVPSESSLVVLLQTGGIDGGQIDTPSAVDLLASGEQIRAYPTDGGNLQVSLRTDDPLFADARLRRALALALDRPAMISGLLNGRGVLSAGDIPPSSWAYSAAAASLNPYDPEKARALLAEAGWQPGDGGVLARGGDRLKFTLSTDAGSELRRDVALTLRQYWRAVGADMELEIVDRNTFVVDRVLKGRFQAALLQSSVRADPDLSRRFHSRAIRSGQNFLAYSNPILDSLLDRALVSSTATVRAPLYEEAQILLARELPQINLFYPTVYYVVRGDIAGIRPSPVSPFWNVEEWGR